MPKLFEIGPVVVENELFNFLKPLTLTFLLGEVYLKRSTLHPMMK